MRVLLVVALGALAGCAAAEAMPPPVQTVGSAPPAAPATAEAGFFPGEAMAFEIKIGGVLAGDAQLAVGELGVVDGTRRVRVKSRAETAGAVALVKHVVDEATTEIELDTGKPLGFETMVETGDRHTWAKGTFVGHRANVSYTNDPVPPATVDKPVKYSIDFGKHEVLEAHAAMGLVRTWRPAIGATRELFVLGGKRVWRVDLQYRGNETLGTPAGNRPVVVFTGKAYHGRGNLTVESERPARTFTVYLSDDADRVPLRVVGQTELGDVVMELTDYSRP